MTANIPQEAQRPTMTPAAAAVVLTSRDRIIEIKILQLGIQAPLSRKKLLPQQVIQKF